MKLISTKYLLAVLGMLISFMACAQDVQYTQFRNSPTYLNPGFTGLSGSQFTFRSQYRRQWYPVFETPLNAFNASFDYSTNSPFTFGAILTHENVGGLDEVGLYQTNGMTISGGWRIPLKKIVIQPALQVSYFTRKLNFDRLVFVDELLFDNPSAFEAGTFRYNFPSFSSGIGVYSEVFWGGFSMFNIDQLFRNREGVLLNEYHSPFRWNVHGGVNLPMPVFYDVNFLASANYRRQEGSEQLDFSAGFAYASLYSLEVTYRGMPGRSPNDKIINSSSVAFIASMFNIPISSGVLHLAYSYDYNLTGRGLQDSSHEISLSLNFSTKNWKNKRQNRSDLINMSCPLSTSVKRRTGWFSNKSKKK